MRRELVEHRGWVSEQRFLDLFAASNLIPGPSSTELGIFLGYERAGLPGLVVAGASFIAPAFVMVLALAWVYVRFGTLPQTGWVLYGVTPAAIGIIAEAMWRMARTALAGVWWLLLSVAAVALFLAGVNVLLVLFGAALIGMLVANRGRLARSVGRRHAILLWPWLPLAAGPRPGVTGLGALFLTFLKFGAVVYGSGYVLLAFLRPELVSHQHWMTDRQLLDAVSVGQVTPGPVFTTATFVGYLVAGFPGAVLATIGIFLPSFVLVAVAYRFLETLRRSPWMQGFLRGATATALGLMAGVTVQLGKAAIVDWFTALLAVTALAVLMRYRVNAAWVVLGGAVLGVLAKLSFA